MKFSSVTYSDFSCTCSVKFQHPLSTFLVLLLSQQTCSCCLRQSAVPWNFQRVQTVSCKMPSTNRRWSSSHEDCWICDALKPAWSSPLYLWKSLVTSFTVYEAVSATLKMFCNVAPSAVSAAGSFGRLAGVSFSISVSCFSVCFCL